MDEVKDTVSPELAAAFAEWQENKEDAKASQAAADKIEKLIKDADMSNAAVKEIAD